jgi:hypothetical protein
VAAESDGRRRGLELAALDRGQPRKVTKGSSGVAQRASPSAEAGGVRPYAHPHYWAAFILVGDPDSTTREPRLDLRKTCATYHDEHVSESSDEILGHSVGGITFRHYTHRAPLAFRAIMALPQPGAFSAILRGGTASARAAGDGSPMLADSVGSTEAG